MPRGCVTSLIHLEVAYLDRIEEINIPDEWVAPIVVVLRKNLETALELETEIGGFGLRSLFKTLLLGRVA